MINNIQLINMLKENKHNIEKKIEYYKLYNTTNKLIKYLLKCGISIDKIRPYFLSGILFSIVSTSLGNNPFVIDDIEVPAHIQTIDTSSGMHLENMKFDSKYDEKLEYSTGWTTNDNGLYTRTITSYRLNTSFDIENTDKVLSMCKEELEKILEISNVEIIETSFLTPDDFIYDKDAIIVTNTFIDDNITKKRPETSMEQIMSIGVYIIFTIISGIILTKFEKKVLKIDIQTKLSKLESKIKIMTNDDIVTLKNILKLKEENLKMLDENNNNLPSYQLRKK